LFQHGETLRQAETSTPSDLRSKEGRAGRDDVLRLTQLVSTDMRQDAMVVLGLY
jgi:tRNA pseudouridine-54 N-methylase